MGLFNKLFSKDQPQVATPSAPEKKETPSTPKAPKAKKGGKKGKAKPRKFGPPKKKPLNKA